jgi:hypothetical protein
MAIGVPRGRQALAVSGVFTCLATFLAAVRIYTRAYMVKQLGADDWTILVSLVSSPKLFQTIIYLLTLPSLSAGLFLVFLSAVRPLVLKANNCNQSLC